MTATKKINPCWAMAPASAKWFAVDADGTIMYFLGEVTPFTDVDPFWHGETCGGYFGCVYNMEGIDWRETLQERPQ